MKFLSVLSLLALAFIFSAGAQVNETNIPIATSIASNDLVRVVTNASPNIANGKTRLVTVDNLRQGMNVDQRSIPSGLGWGALRYFDGTNAAWEAPDSGWVINEHFIGRAATGLIGLEPWRLITSGGGAVFCTPSVRAVGVIALVTTNTGDAAYLDINEYTVYLTNYQFFFLARVKIGTLDNGTDTNTFRIGLSQSSTTDGSQTLGFKTTNNIWAVLCDNGSAVVTLTPSNVLANTWTWLAWRVNGTGTNVVAYIGNTYTNMAPVFTNATTLPSSVLWPVISHLRTAGTTLRMTNFVDIYKLHMSGGTP